MPRDRRSSIPGPRGRAAHPHRGRGRPRGHRDRARAGAPVSGRRATPGRARRCTSGRANTCSRASLRADGGGGGARGRGPAGTFVALVRERDEVALTLPDGGRARVWTRWAPADGPYPRADLRRHAAARPRGLPGAGGGAAGGSGRARSCRSAASAPTTCSSAPRTSRPPARAGSVRARVRRPALDRPALERQQVVHLHRLADQEALAVAARRSAGRGGARSASTACWKRSKGSVTVSPGPGVNWLANARTARIFTSQTDVMSTTKRGRGLGRLGHGERVDDLARPERRRPGRAGSS